MARRTLRGMNAVAPRKLRIVDSGPRVKSLVVEMYVVKEGRRHGRKDERRPIPDQKSKGLSYITCPMLCSQYEKKTMGP